MWHAKAVHICGCFLPKESPLANHIHSSYIKHHLKQKNENKLMAKKLIKEKEIFQKYQSLIENSPKKNPTQNICINKESKNCKIGIKRYSNFRSTILEQSLNDPSIFSPKSCKVPTECKDIESSTKQKCFNYSKLARQSNCKAVPLKIGEKYSKKSNLKMYLNCIGNENREKPFLNSTKYYHFVKNKQKHSNPEFGVKYNPTLKNNSSSTKSFISFGLNKYNSMSSLYGSKDMLHEKEPIIKEILNSQQKTRNDNINQSKIKTYNKYLISPSQNNLSNFKLLSPKEQNQICSSSIDLDSVDSEYTVTQKSISYHGKAQKIHVFPYK